VFRILTYCFYRSYKYNEKAIVWNEKNLVRLWDICYDGYNGGKDTDFVTKDADSINRFRNQTYETNVPYEGASMIVIAIHHKPDLKTQEDNFPSPIVMPDDVCRTVPLDPEHALKISTEPLNVWKKDTPYAKVVDEMKGFFSNFTDLHNRRPAGTASHENETSCASGMAFQGSMRILDQEGRLVYEIHGNGHHGPDYVGAASVRSGKGVNPIPTQVKTVRQV
jgi:hypothetical protein